MQRETALDKHAHPSESVSVIIKSKLFEAIRLRRHNCIKIVFPTRVQALQASAHPSPLELKPCVPRASRNAVIYALEYAGADGQVHFLSFVAAIHVDGY